MYSTKSDQNLLERIEQLERQQRGWRRLAVAAVATGLLLFVGWAPVDDLQVEENLEIPEKPAKEPADAATQTKAQPENPPANENPATAGNPSDGFQIYTHREGDEPYVVSRLEWVALRANAELPRGDLEQKGYRFIYGSAGKGSNAIRIIAIYDPERTNVASIEKELKYAQSQFEALKKFYGWRWLQIHATLKPMR